jgi:hypothetical protein
MKNFLLILPLLALGCQSAPQRPLEFTTMIAHWANYAHADYLPFVKEARPELAQVGFYGGHYWSLAHTKHGGGYPAHFPKVGLAENRTWLAQRNRDLHKLDVLVIGHFNIEFLVGEPKGKDGPRGFFKFYNELWDEKILGPKPVKDPMDLLEKNADGSPRINNSYSIGGMKEYWACLNNPHWRTVLKAWARHGIRAGLDGFMINYFYRHNCLCEHCQHEFREYLGNRFTAAELKTKFNIEKLATHKFTEIGAWHDPAKSTLFKREQLRFSQIATKECFDEVFVKYGRSLKPGLIVGQWNHLGRFGQISGDERCLLPKELWAKDEDYLWYSTGGSSFYTDLKNGFLGEGTLQARYIRGATGGKPFTLGKYESTRTRAAIAELIANGGAPMGFYTRFTNAEARKVITQYYQFIRRNAAIYKGNQSAAESVLLFPRKAVHAGNVADVQKFLKLGDSLLDRHILFDVLPDDLATTEALANHKAVYRVNGKTPAASSRFKITAPSTVRASLSRPAKGDKLHLHFVNYNRTEPKTAKSAGGGIHDEKPIAAEGVRCSFQMPEGKKLKRIRFLTPENNKAIELRTTSSGNQIQINVPKFLVYGVVELEFGK